jgi:hypothetical protein
LVAAALVGQVAGVTAAQPPQRHPIESTVMGRNVTMVAASIGH